MMPSVIPARLQFQCGHAALVTLPRVKGETATQRNDRVAREKTAALARQCDFCAPSVAIVEPVVLNGNHVEVALSDVAESTPVADLAVVVVNESEPSEADAEQIPVPAEPVLPDIVVIEPETSEPEVPEEVVVEAIIESYVEEEPASEPVAQAKQTRKPRARRQPTPAQPAPVPAKPARARRASPRRATPRRAPAVTGQRFVVEYQVEQVVRAATLQDALRQATALGAVDLVAITRQD
jgi:hypothetical protein